jgi:DNA-binding response OmpR family regulator
MALEASGAQATQQRPRSRLRLAVIDRDPGFMQVLTKRLGPLGWDHRALANPVTVEALVAMRLNALVVDVSVLGPESWEYIERVCARLPALAVIVCTGPSSVAQRVRGLRLGCDAWVTKPCHPEELICVVEAAIRRHRRAEMPGLEGAIEVGEITIRPDLYQAYAGPTSLDLTAREFEILQLLANSDRVLRREEIYERVWGYAMAHGDRPRRSTRRSGDGDRRGPARRHVGRRSPHGRPGRLVNPTSSRDRHFPSVASGNLSCAPITTKEEHRCPNCYVPSLLEL